MSGQRGEVQSAKIHVRNQPSGGSRSKTLLSAFPRRANQLSKGVAVLVTIVTPSLNGIRYVKDCIESVRGERYDDVETEHILVDGGSTDGTPEYAKANGCTVLTREERNPDAAVNKGFRHASGALIGVLGCDDVVLPGALHRVVDRYRRDGLPWLIGASRWMNADAKLLGDQPPPLTRTSVKTLASLHWSPLPSTSTFFEPALLKTLDYIDTSFEYVGDYDLALRARRLSQFSRIRHALTAQHRHGDNLSMQRNERHLAELERIHDTYGPISALSRMLRARFMQIILNTMSPRWYMAKHSGRCGWPIGASR